MRKGEGVEGKGRRERGSEKGELFTHFTNVLFGLFLLCTNPPLVKMHLPVELCLGWLHVLTLECSHFRRDRRCTKNGQLQSQEFLPHTKYIKQQWSAGRALAQGHSVTGTCLAKSCFKCICCVHICSDFFPFQPLEIYMGGPVL